MSKPDLEQVGVFLVTLVPVHSNVKDNPNDYIDPRSRLNRRWTDSTLWRPHRRSVFKQWSDGLDVKSAPRDFWITRHIIFMNQISSRVCLATMSSM